MKKYLVISLLVIAAFGCNKSSFNDLSGAQTLKGVVVVVNDLDGTSPVAPAKNFKVYLKYAGSVAGYLYTVTANALGEFSFGGIDPAMSYTIYAASDTGFVKFYGENTYNTGAYVDNQSDTLKLVPSQQSQNGIHLTVTDEQSRPVGGVTAWVFGSKLLFDADSSAGRIFDMPLNAYGVGNKLNIAAGKYYLRIKTRIGNIDLLGETDVDITDKGIKPAAIILRSLARTGIESMITDNFSTPVENAKIYGYRSRVIFENDTTTFSNSVFTVNSNQSGLGAIYGLTQGLYYLRAVKVINALTLKQTTTVTVNTGLVTPAPMKLQ